SIGGGTKRSGTLRVIDADVDGEGDGVSIGDAVGDSCAKARQAGTRPVKIARLIFFVIVAALRERRTISATVIDRLNNNSASSSWGKDCRAIRNRPEIFRRAVRQQTGRATD